MYDFLFDFYVLYCRSSNAVPLVIANDELDLFHLSMTKYFINCLIRPIKI